jgi:cytochrome b involved in lipid metabolism
MWRIFEDAGTLTIFLVILVLDASSSSSSSVSSRFGNIFDDNTFVTNFTWSWTIYKTIHTLKTALEIYRNKQNHPSQQKEAASVIHKQGIRKGHMDSSHLWRIYGQAYDLSDYVNIHPGGKEAILLGRGRPDCTALFESYHPFSKSQVQMILQKYRVQDAPKNKTIDLQKDPFYEILCNRVSQTLQEQQFSPIHDRAATWQRTMYYMIIVCAVVSSGIYHCRVSVDQKRICHSGSKNWQQT